MLDSWIKNEQTAKVKPGSGTHHPIRYLETILGSNVYSNSKKWHQTTMNIQDFPLSPITVWSFCNLHVGLDKVHSCLKHTHCQMKSNTKPMKQEGNTFFVPALNVLLITVIKPNGGRRLQPRRQEIINLYLIKKLLRRPLWGRFFLFQGSQS